MLHQIARAEILNECRGAIMNYWRFKQNDRWWTYWEMSQGSDSQQLIESAHQFSMFGLILRGHVCWMGRGRVNLSENNLWSNNPLSGCWFRVLISSTASVSIRSQSCSRSWSWGRRWSVWQLFKKGSGAVSSLSAIFTQRSNEVYLLVKSCSLSMARPDTQQQTAQT